MELKIKRNNILLFSLLNIFILQLVFFIFVEFINLERVVLPILFSLIIAVGSYFILNIQQKDKFISKIYLISILVHFCFILFWQILKYYILGLPFPTGMNFSAYISDVDGIQYHYIASYIADNFNMNVLSQKYYGGLFPKIMGLLYFLFGKNPFIICCLNSIIGAFVSVITYIIGKNVLKNYNLSKIYALLCIFCTSYIVNTSVLMRDVYITLFMYLTIYFSFNLLKKKNLIYLFLSLISLYILYLFRPYAAIIVFIGIIVGNLVKKIKYEKLRNKLRVNKWTFIVIIISPIILFLIISGLKFLLNNSMLFIKEFSVTSLINVRDTAYVGSNSDYSWDFTMLYNIFPLLPFFIGYICLCFAPFPYEWVYVKRLHFVPDMLVLYCILPSFFKNLKFLFKGKNYYLLVYFFTMFIMFSIYCITVGNSGTIHRLRGPFIPMIYLIAMSRPDRFLCKILNKILKWRII